MTRLPAALAAMFHRARGDGSDPPQQVHPPKPAALAPSPRPASDRSERPDLVVGAISGYDFHDIQYWVNSLDRSGFVGHRLVICYDAAFEVVEELQRRGFHAVTFAEDRRRGRYVFPRSGFRHEDTSIDRFHQIWRFLHPRRDDYRYVVAADIRDIVFQSDPALWLAANLGDKRLNVGSEGLALGDEPWNRDVLLKSYGPELLDTMSGRDVFNAGSIAGEATAVADLALNVFLCSRHNEVPYTDQTAMNVLLSLEPFRSITRFNHADEDWACQAATMADPNYGAAGGAPVTAPRPVLRDGVVLTADGRPYCLVHQYDRVRGWNETLRRTFAD